MSSAWTEQERSTFSEMWNSGMTRYEISQELGKSPNAIKMYVQRHRDELELEKRKTLGGRGKTTNREFDRKWHGTVPFGHWTITKSWSKAS